MSVGSFLIAPGWMDSGPQHWQTHWEKTLGATRTQPTDWDLPELVDWVDSLDRALNALPAPVTLITHSLGCVTLAHLVAQQRASVNRIGFALIVAPADVDRSDVPDAIAGFAPMPICRFPFPARVVASRTDEYCSFSRAQAFATAWGAALTDVGDAGHINVDAGFTEWEDGLKLLPNRDKS